MYDTIRSMKSESDLQKSNSTKSELLEEISSAKMQWLETGLKELMKKTPMDSFRSAISESDLQKPNSTNSELLEEILWAKTHRSCEYKLPETCLKKSNSTKTPVELLDDKLWEKAVEEFMTKTPTHTFRSIIYGSEIPSAKTQLTPDHDLLKEENSYSDSDSELEDAKPMHSHSAEVFEMLDEMYAEQRRSDDYKLKKLTAELEEKSHSDLEKRINPAQLNYNGYSYLGKFLLQRKMNCVDEDMYPGLAIVDEALRNDISFPNSQEFLQQLAILCSCPVTDEKYLFDLDLFPPATLLSYRHVDCEDELAIYLAEAAIDNYNKSANNPFTYKFTKVVKDVAIQQTHYITFQAKDHDGIKHIFQTKVRGCGPKIYVSYVMEKLKNDNSGLSVDVGGQPDSDEIM